MGLAEEALNQLFGLLLSVGRSRWTQWCVDKPLLGLAVSKTPRITCFFIWMTAQISVS
jgi:hypothetical protein